jgi:hypothetical protein
MLLLVLMIEKNLTLDTGEILNRLPESVNLHFHFAPHMTKDDFNGLPELIKSCDVYMPEIAVWDDNLQARYSGVALGNKADYQAIRKLLIGVPDEEAKAFELKLLYGSHKKVVLAGFRTEDRGALDLILANEAMGRMPDASAEEFIIIQRQNADIQSRREARILTDLATKLPNVIDESRKLAEKTQVNVLLNLGAMHTAIYKTTADALNNQERRRVTRTFYKKPVLFPLHVAAIRKHIFMPPVTIEDLHDTFDRMGMYRSSLDEE